MIFISFFSQTWAALTWCFFYNSSLVIWYVVSLCVSDIANAALSKAAEFYIVLPQTSEWLLFPLEIIFPHPQQEGKDIFDLTLSVVGAPCLWGKRHPSWLSTTYLPWKFQPSLGHASFLLHLLPSPLVKCHSHVLAGSSLAGRTSGPFQLNLKYSRTKSPCLPHTPKSLSWKMS